MLKKTSAATFFAAAFLLFRAALSDFFRLLGRPRSLLGALVLSDELRLREQHFAERAEYLQQQIELPQTLAASPHRAEKKLELDPPATIRDRHHARSPLVLTTTTRFDFSEYVGRMAS